MISRKIPSLISLLVCLFLCGCLGQQPTKHGTWVDLNEISQDVKQTKKDIASHQLEEDQKQEKAGVEKLPKTRDLSAGDDVANPYLKGVNGTQRIRLYRTYPNQISKRAPLIFNHAPQSR